MSGFGPTLVFARDLRVLKDRVEAQVSLIDGLVQRTVGLDAGSREAWSGFTTAWRAFVASADGEDVGWRVNEGEGFERKLRDFKSLLSSQCLGVPTPAPKREVSVLPTWVTPNAVREQKRLIGPRVQDLARRVAQAPSLADSIRAAWGQFARAWSTFESDPEEWTHCAAQYNNAQAFEDVLPEWADSIAILTGGPSIPVSPPPGPGPELGPVPAPDPTPRSRGVAPGLPKPAPGPPPAYGPPPGYAAPPSYATPPGYAMPPGYGAPPGYAVPYGAPSGAAASSGTNTKMAVGIGAIVVLLGVIFYRSDNKS